MTPQNLQSAQREELRFSGDIGTGTRGIRAKRVQEWLSFNQCGTPIDGDFGTATHRAVQAFQSKAGLATSGVVDQITWNNLTAPMQRATASSHGSSLIHRIENIAQQNLVEHPIELGGDNRGPWVRLYVGGQDGPEWPWCAGFVSKVVWQACSELGQKAPISLSVSCDTIGIDALANNRLIRGRDLQTGRRSWNELGDVFLFLVRRSDRDWVHIGFGFRGSSDSFSTIEGNTNAAGSSNGFEVTSKFRSAANKDFIVLQ